MRGEVPETIDLIMRWGGVVDTTTLAQMRWPNRASGQRSARELLASLAERGYVERVGYAGQRPLFMVTEAGYYVAAASTYMVSRWSGSPVRRSKEGAKVLPAQIGHTLAVAAVTTAWVRQANSRLVQQGQDGEWVFLTPAELLRSKENREQVKVPDSVIMKWQAAAFAGGFAVEVEASRKTGRLKDGRSNWASLAQSIVDRYRSLEPEWDLVHPSGASASHAKLRYTAFVDATGVFEPAVLGRIEDRMAASALGELKLLRLNLAEGTTSVQRVSSGRRMA